uniref:Uncharacterized protein ORF121_2 n=1 Tax=Nothoceros aenigmaticus TaxID=13813 RepID=C3RYM3_9EMBR|nr:hypothetical protein MeaeMp14 [Nothoceros aenigmaticus]ACC86780.1 hypothetical protein MeaeMp14 [Nothoceros aenigmaticus]
MAGGAGPAGAVGLYPPFRTRGIRKEPASSPAGQDLIIATFVDPLTLRKNLVPGYFHCIAMKALFLAATASKGRPGTKNPNVFLFSMSWRMLCVPQARSASLEGKARSAFFARRKGAERVLR